VHIFDAVLGHLIMQTVIHVSPRRLMVNPEANSELQTTWTDSHQGRAMSV
jgi:hypothetical protein